MGGGAWNTNVRAVQTTAWQMRSCQIANVATWVTRTVAMVVWLATLVGLTNVHWLLSSENWPISFSSSRCWRTLVCQFANSNTLLLWLSARLAQIASFTRSISVVLAGGLASGIGWSRTIRCASWWENQDLLTHSQILSRLVQTATFFHYIEILLSVCFCGWIG